MFTIFHCFFHCVDASLVFLLFQKCPWVFLLLPACWKRILWAFVVCRSVYSAFAGERLFPCTEHFLSRMLFFLLSSLSPLFTNPFILCIVPLPSSWFSDNLWHFSSLIFWKLIKSLCCWYLFCVSLVLTNIIVTWVGVFLFMSVSLGVC